MSINLICCLFVLDNEKNLNIRKNDNKKLKVLVEKDNSLVKIPFKKEHMKSDLKKEVKEIIGTNKFHLEQVFSHNIKGDVDIIYLGLTNIEYIKKIDKSYKLVDFDVVDNKIILFDQKKYSYKTKEIIDGNNIEYYHEIKEKDERIKNTLLEIIISFKRLRSNIDNTDIVFKLLGETYTLEDVRATYELVTKSNVDKSNFRKKIIKYCYKTSEKEEKTGFRPSQRYKFKPLKGDLWI
ncbi:MAG: hypothetical protein IKR04_08015 [Clostridia bacterium]|nr:hypothetical protein [Clostridia bacterium]